MQKQILNYMNIFRGLAIILIVLGHSMKTKGQLFTPMFYEIFSGGTILFIFISGFLFQHLAYKFEYKNYLYKKFINVNSPYFITSIVGLIILFCCPSSNPFNGLNLLIQIPALLSIGSVHNFFTWYIPVINIFFILAPLLLFLESKKISNKSFLYLLIPFFLLITVIFPRIPISNSEVASLNISYFSKYLMYINYLFHSFINIFSVYILGMYFSAYKEKISILYKYRKILIIFMISTAIIDVILAYQKIYFNTSISKIFFTLLLLGYLEHYDKVIIAKEKINKFLNAIAQYSFGIFFLHLYLLKLWYHVILKSLHIPDTITNVSFLGMIQIGLLFIATFAFAFGGSFLICYIIKKILTHLKIKNTRAIIGA